MKRIIKLLLFCAALMLLCSITYGQGVYQLAGNKTGKSVVAGMMKADSILQAPTKKVLSPYFPNDGNISVEGGVFSFYYSGHWVDVSAGGNADSSVFATLYRVDTAKTNLRAQIALGSADSSRFATIYRNDTGNANIRLQKLDTTQSAFTPHIKQIIPDNGDMIINVAGTITRLQANPTANSQTLQSVNSGVMWAPFSLPGYLTYYLQDTASDISNYKDMTNSISSHSEAYVAVTNPANNAVIQKWATDDGLPNLQFIPAGTYGVFFHAYYSGGTGLTIVRVYGEVYKRDALGVETLIATTVSSDPLLTDEQAWTVTVNKDVAENLNRSDRLVLYLRAAVPITDPTLVLHVGFQGSTSARLELPTPAVDASNFVPYVGAVHDLDMGVHYVAADTVYTTTPLIYSPRFLDSIAALRAIIPTSITLSGDVSGTGTTAITTTIGAGKVTNAMLVNSAITINSSSTSLGGSITVGTVRTVTATPGNGISISGSPITGTSGTFTVTNTAPDQTVTIGSGTGATVSGSYPSFTVAATGTGGTVTSVAAASNYAITWTGSPITTTGTLTPTIDTSASGLSTKGWRQKLADSIGLNFLTPANTATVTNKNIHSRVLPAASYSVSVTMDWDTYDVYVDSLQAGALLFNAPTYTDDNWLDERLVLIRDNGTARALTYNAAFISGTDVTLPSTTTLGKWMLLQFTRNKSKQKWMIVGKADGYVP